jgi:hypothetical protein
VQQEFLVQKLSGGGYSEGVTGSSATEDAEMPQCPICKSEAEEIDLGLFDGAGFSCKRHGEFRVAEPVFKESRARTRQQWENALTLAERRAAHQLRFYEYTPFCNGPVMSSLPE